MKDLHMHERVHTDMHCGHARTCLLKIVHTLTERYRLVNVLNVLNMETNIIKTVQYLILYYCTRNIHSVIGLGPVK